MNEINGLKGLFSQLILIVDILHTAHIHAHAHLHYVWFHDTKSALKIAYTRCETIKSDSATHTQTSIK